MEGGGFTFPLKGTFLMNEKSCIFTKIRKMYFNPLQAKTSF